MEKKLFSNFSRDHLSTPCFLKQRKDEIAHFLDYFWTYSCKHLSADVDKNGKQENKNDERSNNSNILIQGTWDDYYRTKKLIQNNSFYFGEFDEAEYVANLTIGTPGQSFIFLIHTNCPGCSFVPDISCGNFEGCANFCADLGDKCSMFCFDSCCSSTTTTPTSPQISGCTGKTKFNSTMSSTFNSTAYEACYSSHSYNLGYVTVDTGAEDLITFGDIGKNQISIKLNGFCLAGGISPSFSETPFDGILDMSFEPNAFDSKLLDRNIFTIYFGDHRNQYNVSAGLITYGGLDKEHCSTDVEYYWQIPEYVRNFYISSVSFGTQNFSNGGDAILDITRSSIVVPKKVYDEIIKTVILDKNGNIACNASVDNFIFNIAEKNFTIPSKNLILQNSDGICTLGIESLPENGNDTSLQLFDYDKLWIFGTPLFRSYCTIFGVNIYEENEFGFAEIIA